MKNRLVILFENSSFQDIDSDDIIFAYDVKCIQEDLKHNIIIYYNPWEASKDEAPRKLVLDILKNYDDEVAVIANTMYSNFFALIYSYFKQLNIVVKDYNIASFLISGGSEYPFVTFERAEGEGFPFLYHHEWLYNPLISQFTAKHKIGLDWRNKCRNSYLFKVCNFFRESYIISTELFKEFYNTHKNKGKSTNTLISVQHSNYNAVSFTNLEGQYIFLKYLTSLGALKFIHITPREFDDDCVKLKGWINIKQILANWSSCVPNFRHKTDSPIYISEFGLSFSPKSLRRAIRTELFIYKNAVGRLQEISKTLFHKDVKCMVTCTSQGRSMIKYTQFGKLNKIKHINCQYVALGQRNFPILNMADEYYIYEKGSFDFYKQKSYNFKFYIPQLFNGTKVTNDKQVIVVYTQPDRYTDKYLYLLQKLGESEVAFKFNVYVKLHYRQDKIESFRQICESFKFTLFQSEKSIRELMLSSDMTISMTSSVLSESLFYRVPAIIYIDEQNLKHHVINSNIGFPEVNFLVNNIHELIDKINNMSYAEYENRLEAFMCANSGASVSQIFK